MFTAPAPEIEDEATEELVPETEPEAREEAVQEPPAPELEQSPAASAPVVEGRHVADAAEVAPPDAETPAADSSAHEVAVEELFFGRNVTTAITVGQARGAALLAAALNDLPVAEYTPATVKQALTGYGNADKLQMQMMVQSLLELAEVPRPDDAADGVAVALCHLQTARYQSLVNG